MKRRAAGRGAAMGTYRGIALRLFLVPLVMVGALERLSALTGAVQVVTSETAQNSAIHGIVEDSAGKLVSGATVRLERKGEAQSMETSTATDGTFAFPSAVAGAYFVSAKKGPANSGRVEVTMAMPVNGNPPTAGQAIVLKLEPNAGTTLISQPMEFSDSPSFTIAAVTDWTAAGGHGSDAILRTSESLTRDAVHLKGATGSADPKAIAAANERESKLRAALALAPESFEANRQLGEFYLHEGRYQEAVPIFETAHNKNPGDFANEYDWALALQGTGDYARAREHVRDLMSQRNAADVLRLAGELDEKLGDPVAAVNELEQAVREDGSEENYFQWGSELLLHRAIWQAKDVFSAGVQRYPKSARMLTALGASLFACSLYDDAARRLCEAADLSPESVEPYLFLGKAEISSPNPLQCAEGELGEFVKRQPDNPLANYYDAMAIWKQSGRSTDAKVLDEVETLLNRAVGLDSKCSDAYLQLGNVNASRHDNAKAIAFYGKAIEANARSAEAHYRLGLAYDRAGDHERAKQEIQLHEELDKEQAAEIERQRREVKQFLVKGSGSPAEAANP